MLHWYEYIARCVCCDRHVWVSLSRVPAAPMRWFNAGGPPTDSPALLCSIRLCSAASEANFCPLFDSATVSAPSNSCYEYNKLQAVRTFAILLVIFSGLATIALAGTDGSKSGKVHGGLWSLLSGACQLPLQHSL